MALVTILSRWIHVLSACVAVGGVFFIRLVLPRGVASLPDDLRTQVLLGTRRTFKRVIHTAILLFIVSGVYNSMAAWDKYKLDPPLLHALWGTHVLLALIAFSIALYVLAGTRPPRAHQTLMLVNLIVLLLAIAAASALKWARENTVAEHSTHSTLSEGQ